MRSKILAKPVFVGRQQELAQLGHYLKLAKKGKGSTIFVSGEAGTGKTRLISEFLDKAKTQRTIVLTGWCLSNATVPYFPFFEAFNAHFSGKPRPKQSAPEELEMTKWLMGPTQAEKVGKPLAISPQVRKDQTFAAVAKTLSSISARKTIILFIDDLQWADSASLALIHYIARIVSSMRVLILATFRSEQIASIGEGRPHPLAETLRLMRREDLFQEIRLANLSETGVSELAKGMLDGDLQQQFSERLAKKSQGNPLFVVETLRMLHERNGLVRDRDRWRLTSNEIGIPVKIRDIVLQRLNVLSRNQRRVLEAASVIGEKFNVELLASLLNQDCLEIIEVLDLIQRDTSFVVCEEDVYRFDHSRSRDAIYDEISLGLKKWYHAKLAEKLERASEKGKPVLGEIAHHYEQAGNKEKASKYNLAAGQDALARWSNLEAIKHFSYVVQAVGEDSTRADEKLSALEGLGDSLYANSMFKEAARMFEELARLAKAEVVRLRAFRKAMEAVFQYGDSPYLMELVKKAEPYAAANRLEQARVLMSRGRGIGMQGKLLPALKDWEAALRVFEEEYSLWDVAWALIAVGINHAQYAITDHAERQGIAESLRSIALFEDLGDYRMQMEACWVAGVAFLNCLLGSEALEILAKVSEIDEKMKMCDYFRMVHANIWSAWSLEEIGDFEKALAFGLRALEFSSKTDSPVAHGMVYSTLTILYALVGDVTRSEAYFEKLVKLPPEILNNINIQPEFPKPVFLAVKGRWQESNQLFEETHEHFKHSTSGPSFAATLK